MPTAAPPPRPPGTSFPRLPRLTADEEQALAARRVAGDAAAREALILHNTALAVSMAGGFRGGRYRRHMPDLVSVALLGLIDAADRYEPGHVSGGRVARFSTYATFWIRQRLRRAASSDLALIRVPRREAEGGAAPDTPSARETAALAARALGASAAGLHGAEFDALATLEARPDGEPAEVHPGLSRALARLGREHPAEYRVVMMSYPADGSARPTFVEVGARIGRSAVRAGQLHSSALRWLRVYLRDAGDVGRRRGAF